MMIDEAIKVLEMQEEILQFSHFTNADAWELGNIIVAEAAKRRLPIAVNIRLNSGFDIFQYCFDDTNYNNQLWLDRKHNTVKLLEKSSLHLCMILKKNEETLADLLLDPKEYAGVGGGFPIRIEEVGVIGSVAVSGMDHVTDHDILIKCISKYMHIDEVPRIRGGKL